MSVVERALDKLRRDSGTNGKVSSQDDSQRIGVLTEGGRLPSDVPQAAAYGRRVLVDRQAVREAGYLPESDQDRQFADHYRQIKRPLIAAAQSDPAARLIMMGSALPGDGKTFTSINLALSMARERDTSVVLVDADVAKRHVSRIFGVEAEPGLVDALVDDSTDAAALVLPTDVRGLSVLSAGRARENAAELFASSRMSQVVRCLLEVDPRRVVLFDTAPLLVSSEARALIDVVGQVVLVVRAVHTPRQAVHDALEHTRGHRSVKLVLNQGRPSITTSYYGQGSYGDYGEVSSA